jgi:hypothetical protein
VKLSRLDRGLAGGAGADQPIAQMGRTPKPHAPPPADGLSGSRD